MNRRSHASSSLNSPLETPPRRLRRLVVCAPDSALRADRAASVVALVTGLIFLVTGLAKFLLYGSELAAFRRFGLPAPEAFVIAAGVIETAGGVLLLRRRLIMPVASTLAATMAVAASVSGLAHGDVVPSLTLAPALLVAMIFLLVRGLRPTASEID